MLSPEYLAHVAERIRNEAEDLEDEVLFIVLLFLLAYGRLLSSVNYLNL